MRYGSIGYVNNLPVDHGMLSGRVPMPAGLSIQSGTPAELNAAIAAAQVDVAAVSSVTLFAPAHGLTILPEATIASHGRVDSVLLVSKVPFDQLDARTVAVSKDSATGALLLRILLERDVGVKPRYVPMPTGLDLMLENADAALLIGDDALRTSAGIKADGETDPKLLADFHVLDLGEAWRAYSGLPMVYALWAARDPVVQRDPKGLAALRRALVASREWGRANAGTVVAEAKRRTQVPSSVLSTYYSRLTHTFGAREREGLARFAEEAAALTNRAVTPAPQVLEAMA